MPKTSKFLRHKIADWLLNHLPPFQESQYNFRLGSFVSAAVRQNRTLHSIKRPGRAITTGSY